MSQELLESRWGETKEALLEGLNGSKRNSMGVILENTRKYLKENASAGSTAAGNIATLNRVILPVIRRVMPTVIANEFEKQIRWLTQDVRSRLNPTGKLIIIGTRVASVDLYRELRQEDRYPGGQVPWTYLAMPALLETNEDKEKWVTLWPKSDQPFEGQVETDQDEDGLYPRWNGKHLSAERQAMDAQTWALVYQQQDVSDNAIFDPVTVRGSIDGMRKAGKLVAGNPGHPRDLNGFSFICGMDPAIVGDTAVVCYAVDRSTHKRYIVDAFKITRPSPAQIKNLIIDWTSIYGPSEWIVEKNAFQAFLTQDEELRRHLASRGVILREHHTGSNKWDSGFGVASMSTLFGTKQADGQHHRDNLMHLIVSTAL